MAEVDVMVPTLGRADKLPGLIKNFNAVTPDRALLVFVLDPDDGPSWDTVFDHMGGPVTCVEGAGSFPVKTNIGVRSTESPLVLLTGDDVVFHDGWLDAALNALEDDSVQVVGTRDLSPITADGSHVTMPILRRSYIEGIGAAWNEPGSCFHEGYHHNYSETETWQLAQHRGVAKFVPESVIEHRHPDWGTRERDATDEKGGGANKLADHNLFERRKAEWLAS